MLIFNGQSKYYDIKEFKDTVSQWPHAFIKLDFDSKILFRQLRSEHIHIIYGDYVSELKILCNLLNIRIIEIK